MGQHQKLLIVDDEERVLRGLNSIFKQEYDVYTCTNATDALKILSRNIIDVIISDQRMPELSGRELLAKVKTKYPDIARILLTGSFDKVGLRRMTLSGEIFGYIAKPWNLNAMKVLVRRAMRATPEERNANHQESIEANAATTNAVTKSHSSRNAHTTALSTRRMSGTVIPPNTNNHLPALSGSVIAAKSDLASKASTGKSLSLILFDKDERVRAQLRKLGASFRLKIYAVNSFEQVVRILALKPDIGLLMFGVAEDAKKTDVALRVMKRYRNDLTIIALANTSSIGQAVNLVNNGRAFRHLHRLADLYGFKRAIMAGVKHQQMMSSLKSVGIGHYTGNSQLPATAKGALSKSSQLYMNAKKRAASSELTSADSTTMASLQSRASIILIERDGKMRDSMQAVARELGFDIYGVGSYVQARATLRAQADVSVVVVGLSEYPERDSAEIKTLKELRQDIAVLTIVNHSDMNVVSSMVNNGLVFRYLSKPLDIFDFERAVQAAIKNAQLQQRFGLLKKQRSESQTDKLVLLKTGS